jgi:hypothetical protein
MKMAVESMEMAPGAIPRPDRVPEQRLLSPEIGLRQRRRIITSGVNVISLRGPRVYLSIIRMDKSDSFDEPQLRACSATLWLPASRKSAAKQHRTLKLQEARSEKLDEICV